MSTTTPTPSSSASSVPTSVPSTLKTSASPLPPRDRVWALFCQGHRSHAIGELLGVPERTVRAWIEVELEATEPARGAERERQRTLAVARLLNLAAVAWITYERLTAPPPTTTDPDISPPSLPSASSALKTPSASAPARYLALAHAAYRDIARLQGLYIPVPPAPLPVDFVIAYRPEGPLDLEAMAAQEAAEQAVERAAALADYPEDDPEDDADDPDHHDRSPAPPAAESAPALTQSALVDQRSAVPPPRHGSEEDFVAAGPATSAIPAEMAAPPASPSASVPSIPTPASPLPSTPPRARYWVWDPALGAPVRRTAPSRAWPPHT